VGINFFLSPFLLSSATFPPPAPPVFPYSSLARSLLSLPVTPLAAFFPQLSAFFSFTLFFAGSAYAVSLHLNFVSRLLVRSFPPRP